MSQVDIADLTNDLLVFINDEVSVSSDKILSQTDLLLTGAIDSLGVIRVTQWLEDKYDIEVDPTEVTLENFQTVDRMAVFCKGKFSAQ